MTLQVASDLVFPLDLVTQAVAILARRGAGKTNTAVCLVEELLEAKQQVVILDPPGAWWGLRSSADGKHPGYPVVVLGGVHGDLPIESTAGELIADLVVDEGVSVILDLSDFTNAEMYRFVEAFARRMFARKNRVRDPMMLVIEESDELAPQTVRPDQTRLLHAMERIAKRGRMYGIGFLAITQRTASLNWNVLSQAEVMIAMQTTADLDIKAIDNWIKRVASTEGQERRKQLLSEIAELPVGTGYVWSPGWLRLFKKVHFRKRRTFDSSATPKPGERQITPKTLADVDLKALSERMAATIQKAKDNDPADLKRRIATLEKQLREQPRPVVDNSGFETRFRDLEAKLAQARQRHEQILQQHQQIVGDMRQYIANNVSTLDTMIAGMKSLAVRLDQAVQPEVVAQPRDAVADLVVRSKREIPERRAQAAPPSRAPAVRDRVEAEPHNGEVKPVKIGGGERKVLGVLALYPAGKAKNELAILAGYSSKRSTIDVILSNLRRAGYIVDSRGGPVQLTDAGREFVGPIEPLPAGEDLLDYWRGHPQVGRGERLVLDVLLKSYPDDLSRDELCRLTGYIADKSTIDVILSKLRNLGLVEDRARRLTQEFHDSVTITA